MDFLKVARLLERLPFPGMGRFMEAFRGIVGRSLSFSYYSYKSGDGLLTHDDRAQANASSLDNSRVSRHGLALVSYVHEEWEADWVRGVDHLLGPRTDGVPSSQAAHQPLHRT